MQLGHVMAEFHKTRSSGFTAVNRDERLLSLGDETISYRRCLSQYRHPEQGSLGWIESEQSMSNDKGFRFTKPRRPQETFRTQTTCNLFNRATQPGSSATQQHDTSTFVPNPSTHASSDEFGQRSLGRSVVCSGSSQDRFESQFTSQLLRERYAYVTKSSLETRGVDNVERNLGINRTPAERSSSPSCVASSPTNRLTLRHDNTTGNKTTLDLQSAGSSDSKNKYDIRRRAPQPHATNVISDSHPGPPIVNGIQLVSTRQLPDRLRYIFPYGVFNSIQSKCWPLIYKADDNAVVCAPTGSGKTVLLELAMCRLFEHNSQHELKIIYMAPTKSLCAERAKDWDKKFTQLGWSCAELTGDTSANEMRKVGNATIIVTTPEKWDSITRKWRDHTKLVQMVRLFLIDEVHILKDQRGATLEAVVSRMKSLGTDLRFVALSATVPNSQDIATWLGKNGAMPQSAASREVFSEDFRPVKLQKHVYGFQDKGNEFAFDKHLDGKIVGLIAKHGSSKPIMVFCFTRSSCEQTASRIADWWSKQQSIEKAWRCPRQRIPIVNKELAQLQSCGVAFHHAGLELCDRAAVEGGFLTGEISVIVCTSTLAVGVNLPCHMVIIKGTVGYTDGQLAEYSDLEIMQMLGRAGRPQFDTSALAIIMTRQSRVSHYNQMMSGEEILESTLHHRLIEHLNCEISLGTVRDARSAKIWLEGTFLNVRLKQNPNHYRASCGTSSNDTRETIDLICEDKIKMLQAAELLMPEARFQCTAYGQAMSKHMIQFETMKLLLTLRAAVGIGQILQVICQAIEFKDLRMKPTERAIFRELNKSACIKFPIKDNISSPAHKAALIIQIQLGGVDLPQDPNFNIIRRQYLNEKTIIFERVQRLIRCVTDCRVAAGDAIGLQNALELTRSLSAGYWDNSHLQMRQIPSIGPAASRKLVQNGIRTMKQFKSLNTADVERMLSRNPPFGRKVLDNVLGFPEFSMTTKMSGNVSKNRQPVNIHVQVHLVVAPILWQGTTFAVVFFAGVSNGLLAHVWHGTSRKLEVGLDITFTVEVGSASDFITCQVSCEDLIGTTKSVDLRPVIPTSAFPSRPILPPTSRCSPESRDAILVEDALYDWHDMPEADVLAAVQKAENLEGKEEKGLDDVDFYDVDDLESADPGYTLLGSKQGGDVAFDIAHEPERMGSGRWACSHTCRNGRLTKAGRPCSHRCCKEGVDKMPRKKTTLENERRKKLKVEQLPGKAMDHGQDENSKAKSSYSNPKLNRTTMYDNIEFLDLVDELSTSDHADLGTAGLFHSKDLQDSQLAVETSRPANKSSRSSYEDDTDLFLPLLSRNPNACDDNDIDDGEVKVTPGSGPSPIRILSSADGRRLDLGSPLDEEDFQDIFSLSDRDQELAREVQESSGLFRSTPEAALPQIAGDKITVPLSSKQVCKPNDRPGLPEWTKSVDAHLIEYLGDVCEFLD